MTLIASQARMSQKRLTTPGDVPTVAPSNDHTDGSWTYLDIYPGELCYNEADGILYTSDGSVIQTLINAAPVFGSDYFYEQDLSVTSNGTTTFQNKLTLSIPTNTLSGGLYRVCVSYGYRHSTTNSDFRGQTLVSIAGGGATALFIEHRQEMKDSGADQWQGWSLSRIIDVNPNDSIEIQYNFSKSGGGTAQTGDAFIEFYKVSN